MATIGHSSLDVFPLALGGNTFGWTSDAAESEAVLDAFSAAGGNFIDSADVYSVWKPGNTGGESERIIGEWMRSRGNRSDVVVATKVGKLPGSEGLGAKNVAAAAEASLSRLQTDYIDLYYSHADDPDTPLEESAAAFDALIRSGKVRAIGLSNYSGARIREWMAVADAQGYARPVAVQPHYNLVHRAEFESDLAPIAAEFNLGVVPYFGIASGFLTGKYRSVADAVGARSMGVQKYLTDEGFAVIDVLTDIAREWKVEPASVALAWLRSRPSVVAPIASARVPEQLPALLASATLDLTAAQLSMLDDVSAGM